jgi:hypothetical protein
MLFNEWKELFKLAHDDFSKQKPIEERRQALSNILGKQIIDNETEYQVLYALQTAYAVIIKIIASDALTLFHFGLTEKERVEV